MQDSIYPPTDNICSPATNYISRTMPAQTAELMAMARRIKMLQIQSINMNKMALMMAQQQQQTVPMHQQIMGQQQHQQPYPQPYPQPYQQPYQLPYHEPH